jgi:hypothetical protein
VKRSIHVIHVTLHPLHRRFFRGEAQALSWNPVRMLNSASASPASPASLRKTHFLNFG